MTLRPEREYCGLPSSPEMAEKGVVCLMNVPPAHSAGGDGRRVECSDGWSSFVVLHLYLSLLFTELSCRKRGHWQWLFSQNVCENVAACLRAMIGESRQVVTK